MQPIHLSAHDSFEAWAENRLSMYNESRLRCLLEPVELDISRGFSSGALKLLLNNIRDFNLAFYRIDSDQELTPKTVTLLSEQLGLKTPDKHLCASEDCISLITDSHSDKAQSSDRKRYIPYTNRALSWHTDGYYNPFHQRVQAFILHCLNPAARGGVNSFIDPEVVYLLLKRADPAFVEALSHPQAMCIPANFDGETCIRSETTSSVFQFDNSGRFEGMRFSQRQRHIMWRDDALTRDALAYLNNILNNTNKWRVDCRLEAGQGVIANNVLHRRDSFIDADESKRLYLRARYYNPVRFNQVRGVGDI